jgi:hypothetical protein
MGALLPLGLVLVSAALHAGWNLIVRSQREEDLPFRQKLEPTF